MCLIAGMLTRVATLSLEVLIPAWPKAEGKPKFETQLSLFVSQLGVCSVRFWASTSSSTFNGKESASLHPMPGTYPWM